MEVPDINEATIREHADAVMNDQGATNGGGDGSATPSIGGSLPPDFELRDDGVYHVPTNSEGMVNEFKVCSPLIVKALTRNDDGEEWGRVLEFKDADGKLHTPTIQMSTLSGDGGECRALLLSLGLEINTHRNARHLLSRYIQESKPDERVRSVPRVGWHNGVFVLPDETVGEAGGERVVLQNDLANDHKFKTKGTLDEWCENVARYCVGNSRLAFAVSAAFAAPLLHIIGEQGGGFHFEGPTSTGKTTTLLAAGSVCGGGDETLGFCGTWSSTANALEAVAEMHNHSLLGLDEIKQCEPRDVGKAAYALANGKGKERLTRNITIRRPFTWNLIFVSSGEVSLQSLIGQNGQRFFGGQAVRLCDVPADTGKFGVFENLHDFESAGELADHLRTASKRYYGMPLREGL